MQITDGKVGIYFVCILITLKKKCVPKWDPLNIPIIFFHEYIGFHYHYMCYTLTQYSSKDVSKSPSYISEKKKRGDLFLKLGYFTETDHLCFLRVVLREGCASLWVPSPGRGHGGHGLGTGREHGPGLGRSRTWALGVPH